MKFAFVAGLLAFCGTPLLAETPVCTSRACPQTFRLQSISETRAYGVLIVAPDVGCKRVRYVVRSTTAVLGRTPPLGPGQLAVVRMGRGFSAGDHDLTIAPVGCGLGPVTTRRVALAKASPDHGWQSAK